MATDNEVLWVVSKEDDSSNIVKSWLFRTRAAARLFAADKAYRSKRYDYLVSRAKWGPEQ